jgi:alanine-glyoxylate transaminase/serine-glyoxylate transaminase/serine-pyruvate transaminase
MRNPDRLLMGPGPSNPYPAVTMALAGPLLGHLDPDFLAILDETCERLREVFGTGNALTLPISGTGSAGMEASFVNVVRPGDVVVVGVNGVFGERMCEVADRLGAEVIRVEAEWGEPLDPGLSWPRTLLRRSSPSSTPRRPRVCAMTSKRLVGRRVRRCSWWTP